MADRRTLKDPSKANKELAEANKQLTSQMEKINEKLDAITKLIKAIPTMGNNNRGGRFTNNRWQPSKLDPHGYCWSCGYRVDKKHNSVTCLKKKDGIKMQQQGQTPWAAVKMGNSSSEKEEGQ
eukprot:2807769-Ditylum_brightwellii.AAC.1